MVGQPSATANSATIEVEVGYGWQRSADITNWSLVTTACSVPKYYLQALRKLLKSEPPSLQVGCVKGSPINGNGGGRKVGV